MVPRVEQSVTPEKSRDELYFDTLKAKRDVLSSHYTMNQLRKSRKVEEMSDVEVEDYKSVKNEYHKRKELFLVSIDKLNEDDSQKVSELTSLIKVEIVLSSLEKSVEAETEAIPAPIKTPEEIVGEIRIHLEEPVNEGEVISPVDAENPDRGTTMEEVDWMLKYSQDTARPLETAYWESKKAELLERQEAEANVDKPAPKGFVQRVRDSYEKAKDAIMGANRISGGSESVESRMSPLGLRHEPLSPVAPNEEVVESAQPESAQPETIQPEVASPEQQQIEKKPKKASGWGWLKERGKGVWNFGLWEFHQAERLRSKTKEVENDVRALAVNIQHEINLEPEEAETTAWEIVNELKSKNLGISAPEFFEASRDIFGNKAKENAEQENYIVNSAWEDLQEKAKKYRGEAGQDVFTEEIKAQFKSDLRKELNKVRDGAVKEDVVKFAGVMRKALDENWQWRYVWGAAEAALGFVGVKYLVVKIEQAALAKLLAAEKAAGVVKGGAGAIEQVFTQKMHENIWTTLKEMAQNGPQHLNLDNSTLQELSQKVLDSNGMYEKEWVNQAVEGLRSSRVLPEGLPINVPLEVLKVLGY